MAIDLTKSTSVGASNVPLMVQPRQHQVQGFCLLKKSDFAAKTKRTSDLVCPRFSKFAFHGDHKGPSWKAMGGQRFTDCRPETATVSWRVAAFVNEQPAPDDRQRHNQSNFGHPTIIFRKHNDPALCIPRVQFGSGISNGLKKWKA